MKKKLPFLIVLLAALNLALFDSPVTVQGQISDPAKLVDSAGGLADLQDSMTEKETPDQDEAMDLSTGSKEQEDSQAQSEATEVDPTTSEVPGVSGDSPDSDGLDEAEAPSQDDPLKNAGSAQKLPIPEAEPVQETVATDPKSKDSEDLDTGLDSRSQDEAETQADPELLELEDEEAEPEDTALENEEDQEGPSLLEADDADEPADDVTEDTPPSNPVFKVIVETHNQPALTRAHYRDPETYEAAVRQAETEVDASYQAIKDQLQDLGFDIEKDRDFAASFTGFSTQVTQEVMDLLKITEGVRSVRLQDLYHAPALPSMASSGSLIGMDLFDDSIPYKGERIVVSVIDTGFDISHPDFQMEADVPVKYDQESMEALIEEHDLPGVWVSNKIPYAYNYADNTHQVKAFDEHGTHVAGTIGANGNPEEGGIRGIAPHVQILAMKAFTEDRNHAGVYEDVWLKAFDDSIKLGADIINMSLGSVSGFNMGGSSPMKSAIDLARSKGILPIIAAGNERNSSEGADYNNLALHPDQGLMGYPASVDSSFAVASFDNLQQYGRYLEVKYGDEEVQRYRGSLTYPEGTTAPLPIIEFGLGNADDYRAYEEEHGEGPDFTGHILLVQRGDATFNEKYQLATEHGAEGVVIYDNLDQDFPMEMTGLENLDEAIMFIRMADGKEILKLDEIYPNLTLQISDQFTPFAIDTADNLSRFSTWGPSLDLMLKPDIAAPGGYIYSLISDSRYQDMSGTSMATPHMAGAAALVIQRLYEDGYLTPSPEGRDPRQDDLTMLMLMNTARPKDNTVDPDAFLYTPIQQGAGMLDLHKALVNTVVVTATNSKDQVADGKLELKEVDQNFDYHFEFTNLGDQDTRYHMEFILLKENVDDQGRYLETTEVAQRVYLGEITVPAGQRVSYGDTASTYRAGDQQFVQGYFLFTAQEDQGVDLSVPFLGFKGDWDKLPILDQMLDFVEDENAVNYIPLKMYDEEGNVTFIEKTGFASMNLDRGWTFWNASNLDGVNTVFVHANGREGLENAVTPILSFLRNALDVTFSIEDASGQQVIQPGIITRAKKVNQLYKNEYNYLQDIRLGTWDFTNIHGELVDEGIYTYVIEGRIDSPEAESQRYEFRIVLDNHGPEFSWNRDGGKIKVSAEDNLSGIQWIELYAAEQDSNYIDGLRLDPYTLTHELEFDLPQELANQAIEIFLMDHSGNRKWVVVDAQGEIWNPEPLLPEGESPEEPGSDLIEGADQVQEQDRNEDLGPEEPVNTPFTHQDIDPDQYLSEQAILTREIIAFDTYAPWDYQGFGIQDRDNEPIETISVEGQVFNFQELHRLEYQLTDSWGQPLDLSGTAQVEIMGEDYIFTVDIPRDQLDKNQVYAVQLTAYGRSAEDNLVQSTVSRRFRHDTQPATIAVQQVFGEEDEAYLYFLVDFKDNMNYVEAWAGSSMIGRIDKTWDTLEPYPVSGQVLFKIPANDAHLGKELTFKATDDFNNQGEDSTVTLTLDTIQWVDSEIVHVFNPELGLGSQKEVQAGTPGIKNTHADENVYLQAPVPTIIHLGPVLDPSQGPIPVRRVPDFTLLLGQEQLVQEGQRVLINPLTGEIVQEGQARIIAFRPLESSAGIPVEKVFDPQADIDSLVKLPGQGALIDPKTQEILKDPVASQWTYGPVLVDFDTHQSFDPKLGYHDQVLTVEGVQGLANPLLLAQDPDAAGTWIRPVVDAVIKLGPLPVPYETLRIPDASLSIQEEKIVQAGQLGSKNPLTGHIYIQAKDAIVHYGTKAVPTAKPRPNTEELDAYIQLLEGKLNQLDQYRKDSEFSEDTARDMIQAGKELLTGDDPKDIQEIITDLIQQSQLLQPLAESQGPAGQAFPQPGGTEPEEGPTLPEVKGPHASEKELDLTSEDLTISPEVIPADPAIPEPDSHDSASPKVASQTTPQPVNLITEKSFEARDLANSFVHLPSLPSLHVEIQAQDVFWSFVAQHSIHAYAGYLIDLYFVDGQGQRVYPQHEVDIYHTVPNFVLEYLAQGLTLVIYQELPDGSIEEVDYEYDPELKQVHFKADGRSKYSFVFVAAE